jgi:hypothetical protein
LKINPTTQLYILNRFYSNHLPTLNFETNCRSKNVRRHIVTLNHGGCIQILPRPRRRAHFPHNCVGDHSVTDVTSSAEQTIWEKWYFSKFSHLQTCKYFIHKHSLLLFSFISATLNFPVSDTFPQFLYYFHRLHFYITRQCKHMLNMFIFYFLADIKTAMAKISSSVHW